MPRRNATVHTLINNFIEIVPFLDIHPFISKDGAEYADYTQNIDSTKINYMKTRKLKNLKTLITFLCSTMVLAQNAGTDLFEMTLDELINIDVSTISKEEEKIIDAPGTISVFTRREINNFSPKSLKELLSRVVGVFPITSGDFRNAGSASIRAQHSSSIDKHILILINGKQVLDPYTGGLNHDIFRAFPVKIIERLEVVRGPGSVLYGTSALEGVVNIITNQKELKDTHHISLGRSDYDETKVSLSSRGQFKSGDLNYTFGAQLNKLEDWKIDHVDADQKSGKYNLERQDYNLYGNINYKNSRLQVLKTQNDELNLGGSLSLFPQTKLQQRRYFTNLGHTLKITKNYSVDLDFIYNRIHVAQEGELDAKANELNYEIVNRYSSDKLKALFGASYKDTDGKNTNSTGEQSYTNKAYRFYTQFNYKIINPLNLIVGFQFNNSNNSKEDYSPRLGTIYKISPYLSAKVLYAKAYRAPSGFERSIFLKVGSGDLKGDPNLNSEQITTFSTSLIWKKDNHYLDLTAYRSKQEDTIRVFFDASGSNDLDFINQGTSRYEGIELEYKFVKNKFDIYSAFSYQENLNKTGERNTQKVPNFMAKIGFSYQFMKRYKLGLYDNYYSKIDSPKSAKMLNPDHENYHHVTLNIQGELDKFTVLFQVDNLLENDEVFAPDVSSNSINTTVHSMGRSFYLEGGMKF